MRLKIFEITLGIRKYRSIIEQKEEKENIKQLEKSKLNSIGTLTTKALADLYISPVELAFFCVKRI